MLEENPFFYQFKSNWTADVISKTWICLIYALAWNIKRELTPTKLWEELVWLPNYL